MSWENRRFRERRTEDIGRGVVGDTRGKVG